MQLLKDKQDEVDREGICLFGSHMKTTRESKEKSVVSLDQRCFNCITTSGQDKGAILQGFKMACLNYMPGLVKVAQKQVTRAEVTSH